MAAVHRGAGLSAPTLTRPTVADFTVRRADRAALIGASNTGKSTLGAYLLSKFREQEGPDARILVLDTKPRWRAEYKPDGRGTRRMYKHFVPGDVLPGSMTIDSMTHWPIAWDHDTNPSQTVIAQRLEGSHRDNMRFQIAAAERYFRTQRHTCPSLIYIDEGHDFYSASASAVAGSDIIQRCVRAGREKGLATLIGMQRPKGMNLQTLTELNKVYLFRIQYEEDVKRLTELGWPRGVGPPDYSQPHAFKFMNNEASPDVRTLRLGKVA